MSMDVDAQCLPVPFCCVRSLTSLLSFALACGPLPFAQVKLRTCTFGEEQQQDRCVRCKAGFFSQVRGFPM